ncbi:transposase, partial [Massilia sp. GCM10020059]
MFYLGIDVSKGKLDCALLDAAKDKIKSKVVTNDVEGFSELQRWLKKQKAEVPHVVMEPTGVYHEPAAFFLSDAGLTVSFVNPSQIRSFAQG